LIVREICEAYCVLPKDIESMHLDQILLLICDKEFLKTGRRLVKGTPQELMAKGLIDNVPELSYVQRVTRGLE